MKPAKKRSLPPDTALYPLPVVLVSAGTMDGPKNLITIAWTGTLCSEPPTVGIGVRRSRHSHQLISKLGEFVVNVPDRDTLAATDWCGCVSGRSVDKFERAGLTPVAGEVVRAPMVAEFPLNLECKVRQTVALGSHDVFLGEVVRVHVAEGFDGAGFLQGVLYGFGRYWSVGPELGRHGFAARRF